MLYDLRSGAVPYGTPYCPSVQNQDRQDAQGGVDQSPLTQCFWTFFWLALLLAVAFPVGFLSIMLYVLLSPLSAPCPAMMPFVDFLLKVSQFPLLCTKYMAIAKPLC